MLGGNMLERKWSKKTIDSGAWDFFNPIAKTPPKITKPLIFRHRFSSTSFSVGIHSSPELVVCCCYETMIEVEVAIPALCVAFDQFWPLSQLCTGNQRACVVIKPLGNQRALVKNDEFLQDWFHSNSDSAVLIGCSTSACCVRYASDYFGFVCRVAAEMRVTSNYHWYQQPTLLQIFGDPALCWPRCFLLCEKNPLFLLFACFRSRENIKPKNTQIARFQETNSE